MTRLVSENQPDPSSAPVLAAAIVVAVEQPAGALVDDLVADLARVAPVVASSHGNLAEVMADLEVGDGDLVAIVDAARPLTSASLVCRVAASVAECAPAVAAVPVTDTVRDASGELVDRDAVLDVQGPLVAQARDLEEALSERSVRTLEQLVDALVASRAQLAVVEGDSSASRATTSAELALVRAKMSDR